MITHEVHVSIYDNEFTLRTDEDPAALEALALTVDADMRRMGEESGLMQGQKVATLTALQYAAEAKKAREECETLRIRADACLNTLEPLLSAAVQTDDASQVPD